MSDTNYQLTITPHARRRWGGMLVAAFAAVVIVTWLWFTPEGVLGKADAIGYAVCHRIAGRSFEINGRPLPLCARCSGMFLGALLAMGTIAASGRGKSAGLPPLRVSLVLLGLVAIMGFDGINSYLTFFPNAPHLYEPQNWLRLITGLGAGIAIGSFVLPSFNGSVWREVDMQRSIGSVRELGLVLALAGVFAALILTENSAVLYGLALASSGAVLLLLAMIQVTLWLSVLRRTNRVEGWRSAFIPLLGGVALAVAQVGVIDAARLAFTGTWGGFAL